MRCFVDRATMSHRQMALKNFAQKFTCLTCVADWWGLLIFLLFFGVGFKIFGQRLKRLGPAYNWLYKSIFRDCSRSGSYKLLIYRYRNGKKYRRPTTPLQRLPRPALSTKYSYIFVGNGCMLMHTQQSPLPHPFFLFSSVGRR